MTIEPIAENICANTAYIGGNVTCIRTKPGGRQTKICEGIRTKIPGHNMLGGEKSDGRFKYIL